MGDTWQCGECETVNPRGALTCQACLSSAPATSAKAPAAAARRRTAGRAASGMTAWTCAACETVNAASSLACTACRQPRSAPKSHRPAPKPRRTSKHSGSPGSARPGGTASPSPFRPVPPRTAGTGRESPLPDIGLTGLGDPSRFFPPGTGSPASDPPRPREPYRAAPVPPPAASTDGFSPSGAAPTSSWDSPPSPEAPAAPGHREGWTPPPPSYRPARRKPGKLIAFLVLLAVAGGAFLTRGDWLPAVDHLTGSGRAVASPPAGPRCPAGIAATINGGENSTLIAAYNSVRFKVRMCETSTGEIYYHGSDRNHPSMHITLPAQRSRHGFKAQSNDYVYYVSKHRLVITKNGVKVLDERLKPVS